MKTRMDEEMWHQLEKLLHRLGAGWRANMKICWSHGANVACFGKIFNDGWGAIIWMKRQKKPWIWKVTTK